MIHTHLKPFPKDFLLDPPPQHIKPSLRRPVGRRKRPGAQRSSPSNAAIIPPWAGPSPGVRNGSMSAAEPPSAENPEDEITDEERKTFCEQVRRLRESLQHSTSNESERESNPRSFFAATIPTSILWKPQSLIIRKLKGSKPRKGSLRIASGNSSMPPTPPSASV